MRYIMINALNLSLAYFIVHTKKDTSQKITENISLLKVILIIIVIFLYYIRIMHQKS